MAKTNPYIAGNPVGNTNAFVGREDVLQEVFRVLNNPNQNAIVLFGQRRIGKTSILQHLASKLPQENRYRPIYYDLQDKAAWRLSKVISDLAQTIAIKLRVPIPSFTENIEISFYREWIPQILNSLPKDSSLVLLFDEFDVLADPKAEKAASEFFPYLRTLIGLDPKRLKFVFVLGRSMTELSSVALSIFKSVANKRVSLLRRPDVEKLIQISVKEDNSLRWSKESIDEVWRLTHGHPFLTQALCSTVWDYGTEKKSPIEPQTTTMQIAWQQALERSKSGKSRQPLSSGTNEITVADVKAAVDVTLDTSSGTLEWLWDGLGPAQQVVISALAQSGPGTVNEERLVQILHESGVRLIIRQLRDARKLLHDWDLLEPSDDGFCFRVELLRLWLVINKPLSRVQEVLDRIQPMAENLYLAANGYYESGKPEDIEQAKDLLKRALRLNTWHLRANELLSEIYISEGDLDRAENLLEILAKNHAWAANERLIRIHLERSREASSEARLALFEKILQLDPSYPEALDGIKQFWLDQGKNALSNNELNDALFAYKKAGAEDLILEIEMKIQEKAVLAGIDQVRELENNKSYKSALALVKNLNNLYPNGYDWYSFIESLNREVELADKYQHALGALKQGDSHTVISLLTEIIAIKPDYEEVTRYLHLAVTGEDVIEIVQKANDTKTALDTEIIKIRDESDSAINKMKGDLFLRTRQVEALQKEMDSFTQQKQLEIDAITKQKQLEIDTITKQKHQAESNEILLRNEIYLLKNSKAAHAPVLAPPKKELNFWNPLDHLRIFWWMLFDPEKANDDKSEYYEHYEYFNGAYYILPSTISISTILPLFISYSLWGTGFASLPKDTWEIPFAYFGGFVIVVIEWFFFSLLARYSPYDDKKTAYSATKTISLVLITVFFVLGGGAFLAINSIEPNFYITIVTLSLVLATSFPSPKEYREIDLYSLYSEDAIFFEQNGFHDSIMIMTILGAATTFVHFGVVEIGLFVFIVQLFLMYIKDSYTSFVIPLKAFVAIEILLMAGAYLLTGNIISELWSIDKWWMVLANFLGFILSSGLIIYLYLTARKHSPKWLKVVLFVLPYIFWGLLITPTAWSTFRDFAALIGSRMGL